jgi:hypothetical protein
MNSPMSSRPYPDPGQGGQHPGNKDGADELKGAVAGQLNSPMASAPVKQPGASTAGAPTGPFQVTEDVQKMEGGGAFPTGTSSRVGGG